MLNDLFRTYKKIIILVLVLVSAIIFWFFGCHKTETRNAETQVWERISSSQQGYRFQTDVIRGSVYFGTQGYLVEDKILPVTLSVTSEEESFVGTMKITLPGENGKGVAYQSAVNCTKGVTQTIVLDVPRLGNVSCFSFEILDQYGTNELAEMILASTDHSEKAGEKELREKKTFCVGVLSNSYAPLEWMDGIELENEEEEVYEIQLVRLSKKTLPSRTSQLKSLSAILIDDYNMSGISLGKKKCLQKWVQEEGGILLAGTGASGVEIFSDFPELLDVSPGKAYQTGMYFYNGNDAMGNVSLSLCHLKPEKEGEWETIELSSPESCFAKDYGKGSVVLLGWSLTDQNFLQWTGKDRIVQEVMKVVMRRSQDQYNVGETSMWYVKKALYSFLNSQLPNTFYYAVFFLSYLVALGVFAYYVLRRMKRMEYIWVAVPGIAVLFTGFMLVRTGGIGGMSDNSYSALQVLDAAEEERDVYLLYQNNDGESSRIDLVPEVTTAEPVDYDYRTESADLGLIQKLKQEYTINNTQSGFDIDFEEAVPGTSRLLRFSLNKKNGWKKENCFQTDISVKDSSFSGTVSNLSQYDFTKVVLIRGSQYVILNDLKAGEQQMVKEESVVAWSGYDKENSAFGLEGDTSAEGSLLEYIQEQYITGKESGNTMIVAGITEDRDIPLFADNNELKHQLSVYVEHIPLQMEEDTTYIANINTAYLDEEYQSSLAEDILEARKTRAVYQFDSNQVVWSMIRNRDSFEGTIYAYNYKTREEEKILNHWDETLNCLAMEDYLSDMNTMILTYYLDGDNEYGGAPVLSLVTKDVK